MDDLFLWEFILYKKKYKRKKFYQINILFPYQSSANNIVIRNKNRKSI